jgi:6-pyruvoyltetrahydropterin/6-carboxytetrahydropterin synthase
MGTVHPCSFESTEVIEMLELRHGSSDTTASSAPAAVTVTRRLTFAAAHVLSRTDWDAERNEETFGQCVREHGHNYVLEVGVRGAPDPDTGMVINLKELDRVARDAVVEDVDHRHLNHDVDFLAGLIPTAENLALAFWSRIEERLEGATLQRLRLVESENNSVEVSRP